jgi:glycogen debranching enzyme
MPEFPHVPALTDHDPLARGNLVSVSPGPGLATINHGSTFLVGAHDGTISHQGGEGLYSDDTRFLSHHEIQLNGRSLRCLATARLSFRHMRWTLAPSGPITLGDQITDAPVTVRLDRVVSARRLHEDLVVHSYDRRPVTLLLSLRLQSDFADVFEVRSGRWQRRTRISTAWAPPDRLETRYQRDGFTRRCELRVVPSSHQAIYANGLLSFPIDLAPGDEWSVCLQYDLLTTSHARPSFAGCPLAVSPSDLAERLPRRWHRTVARARAADPRLLDAFNQAVDDFAALRLYDHDFSPDVWIPAAGIPWYVAVFGRDSIIASLQTLPVHPLLAVGTLQKLAQWQSDVDDPVRDAEPGKICHEMRVGEWAQFRTVPHSPYYGTADATPLYLLLLAETYRWLGDSELLRRFHRTAERCLEWIDRWGDRDGDGLYEYAPRTPSGYRNHCWRDAEDGVLDEQGELPPHPIGTCEMQAYVYAAKLNVAALFEAWGEADRARSLRSEAESLRRRFLEHFWLPDDRTVAFALDGTKRPLRTATSNPGHCLWLGMLDQECGTAVAERLMKPDLSSGWGLRTLSCSHPAYDPHSYQRGSVWPHDTMLAAAGMRRYGRMEDAWRLIDGLLAAVATFPRVQMPELFAGLPRLALDAPVPYEMANVPQAWAAGSIFHAFRVLLGLEPDVPGGKVYVDPMLPPWCPELYLDNVRIGGERLTLVATRRPDGCCDVDVESHGGALAIVRGRPPWLDVPQDRTGAAHRDQPSQQPADQGAALHGA